MGEIWRGVCRRNLYPDLLEWRAFLIELLC